MKNLTRKISSVLFFLILSITISKAQKNKTWDFGLGLQYGKDFYMRNYYPNEMFSSVLPKVNFKSNSSIGANIFAERHISSFSIVTQINYFISDVPTNTICDCSLSGSVYLQEEKHHRASMGTGLRWYILNESKVKPFVEAGIQEDWFVGYYEKRDNKKEFNNNAAGYKRFVPTGMGAIGLKYRRLALIAQFHHNLSNSFKRNAGISNNGIEYSLKSEIVRRAFSFKATYSLISR